MSTTELVPYGCAFCSHEWDRDVENTNKRCPECGSFATSPQAYNPY